MKQVVIMPGGFHPFHAGHYALYQQAQDAFPGADVYVAATNDTSTRPFPFALKEKLAKLAGVNPGKFIQVKSPFRAMEIVGNMDPTDTQLIFVRSTKDADKPPQAGGVKKDGTPAYLQLLKGQAELAPMAQHAYMAYLPTVEFGPGMTSATEIRTAWPTLNEKRKTALVMSLYPRTQKNPRLAATVVKMLDAAIGTDLAESNMLGHVMFKSKPTKFKKIQPAVSRTKDFMKKDFSLSEAGGAGRWYTDDEITNIVGDGWYQDLDLSGANLGVPDDQVPKEWLIQQAQDWLDNQGYNVQVSNVNVGDDDCDWYIEGNLGGNQNLHEFAPDEGGGSRKFIPWTEFIEQVKQIVAKDFDCVENVVKTTIKARFVPHDPMEYGPTMLYSYYETRAGRNKGAVSTRGAIQVGKYTGGGFTGQIEGKLLTTFSLLKGHPFERHFDLTFDNIYKVANIIMGNTEGALEFKPEQVAEDYVDEKK